MERKNRLQQEITRRISELPKPERKRVKESKQLVEGIVSELDKDIARLEQIFGKYKVGHKAEAKNELRKHLRETSDREEKLLKGAERLEKLSRE